MRLSFSWILFSVLGISHLTGGTEKWTKPNSFLTHSSQVPSSSSNNRRVSPAKENYDYTNGFPQGFSQGLPTFDFTGPMAAAGAENKETHQSAETENVGFVHGPPEGFPSLEQLGGKFPSFGGESSVEHTHHHQSSPSKQSNSYHRQQQHQPNYASPAPPSYSSEEYDDDYLAGPGPSSSNDPEPHLHEEPDNYRPAPSSPYRRVPQSAGAPLPPHPPITRHPAPYKTVQAAGSSPHSKYPGGVVKPYSEAGPGHSLPRYQPKKPIVLKVGSHGQKHKSEGLPPGPPVFYAPSPDMQSSSHPGSQDNNGANSYDTYRRAGRPTHHRYRRSASSLPGKSQKNKQIPDLKPAASESETFWELTSSPFIIFDTYKNPEKEEQSSTTGGNISFVDGQDADGGEQRFFPSFPAPPAPYLVGPFGGGPPSRPPLFPGPAANRAPSRYHPQYAGHNSNKYAPPPPNRGPSNVYSAESQHDHYQDNNLLGSGNFEVVRGGTYYGDDDDGYHGGGGGGGGGGPYHEHDDGDYYHHNGHSSPQEGYRLPGHDFFANFRDFADINPPSRSFSHRHEALAAEPRETITPLASSRSRTPKNILDKLENPAGEHGAPSSHPSSSSSSSMSKDSDPMMATF